MGQLKFNGLRVVYLPSEDRQVLWTWNQMIEKTREEWSMAANPKRPRCPDCGRELIYVSLAFSHRRILSTWVCDCERGNQWLRPMILRCREWDEHAIVIDTRQLLRNLRAGLWPYPAEYEDI